MTAVSSSGGAFSADTGQGMSLGPSTLAPIGHEFVTDRDAEPAYPAQFDQRTCGIAALAAACARVDEATGGPFRQYRTLSSDGVGKLQRELHRVASWTGLPWPRFFGTSPWALAALARRATGIEYEVRLWNIHTSDLVSAANAAGHDAFVYVGEKLVPRHVVLFLGHDPGEENRAVSRTSAVGGGQLRIFEPAIGRIFVTDREKIPTRWTPGARQAHWGWWTRPLLAVLPKTSDV